MRPMTVRVAGSLIRNVWFRRRLRRSCHIDSVVKVRRGGCAAMEGESESRAVDSTIGKYRLLAQLGHGGMADVYLAVAQGPSGFNKLCVCKVLRSALEADREFVTMFMDEARL